MGAYGTIVAIPVRKSGASMAVSQTVALRSDSQLALAASRRTLVGPAGEGRSSKETVSSLLLAYKRQQDAMATFAQVEMMVVGRDPALSKKNIDRVKTIMTSRLAVTVLLALGTLSCTPAAPTSASALPVTIKVV